MQPPDLQRPSASESRLSAGGTDACANCGEPLDGPYCAACGQKASPFLRPIHHLGREVVEDYFGFDGKLWRTVVPLLIRPGHLTNEYLGGRRNYYVRPVRLYLTASILLFFLISVLPGGGGFGGTFYIAPEEPAAADSLDASAEALAALDAEIATLDSTRAGLAAQRDSLRQAVVAGVAGEVVDEEASADTAGFWYNFGQIMGTQGEKVGEMGEEEARRWFVGAFASNMPKAMFVLLPLFALLLKLLYVRRKRYYGEHLVFALHTHAFAFCVYALLAVMLGVTGGLEVLTGWKRGVVGGSVLVLMASVPVYVLVALRRVYDQGWVKTLVKGIALMYLYFIALGLAMVVVVVAAFLVL